MRDRRIGPRASSSKHRRDEEEDDDDEDTADVAAAEDDGADNDDDEEEKEAAAAAIVGFASRRRAAVIGLDDLFLFFPAPSASPCPGASPGPCDSAVDKACCNTSHRSTNRNVTAAVGRLFLSTLVIAHCNDSLSISILSKQVRLQQGEGKQAE